MTQTFFEAQDILAASLPGYTRREHQMALGAAIEQALAYGLAALDNEDRPQPGLFNAGCGTGKSLAGLIPLIIRSVDEGERAVVATKTKILQDQYRGDLTFLQEHLGIPFTWAVLKGRSNYPCWMKITDPDADWNFAQRQVIAELLGLPQFSRHEDIKTAVEEFTWQPGDEIPDQESLPETTPQQWRDLSVSADDCPGKKACPFGRICVAERAKAKAEASNIVITNMAYLLQDLKLRAATEAGVSLLGDYRMLLVDEAHNLPDVATDALSDTLNQNAFEYFARDIDGFLHDNERDQAPVGRIRSGARWLWTEMTQRFEQANRDQDGRVTTENPLRISDGGMIEFVPVIEALIDAVDECRNGVLSVRGLEPETREGRARIKLLRRCDIWRGRLITLLFGEGLVRWIEMEEIERRGEREKRLVLRTAPMSPAGFLNEELFAKTVTIMESATLAIGKRDSFRFMRRELGVKGAVEFDAGSPFDFSRQALLYVPEKGTPEPKGAQMNAWRAWAQTATRMLVKAADGNALLLYTSRSAMNEAYANLHREFEEAGLTVLRQGDGTNQQLIAQLKSGRAVLFGLKTFFEGVDVQGEACKLVVIDKLPFAVPTDILYQARCDDLDKRLGKWTAWRELTIPGMTLPLIQGVGRLIRHANDRGVMAVLDPRLESAKWGPQITGSLPPAPKTTDIREAMAFLKG